ncbi:MAG: GDSL family lipase [Firmicutes bacterium HGW-Firmicutes-15]|nr:MAG: GDSL family lipase [Firmicutes bacterium HGW-Firmicutes-15]
MRRVVIILFILTTMIYSIEINDNLGFSKNKTPTYSDSPAISDMKPSTDITQLKPVALTKYPPDAPAPNIPLLRWTIPPGSVYYEIEFLTAPAEKPNDTSPSIYQFYASREVFVNGYSIDLSTFLGDHLYWRVRGIDFNGNPIGVFSDATPLYIDHTLAQILKPISNTGYKQANMPMPLYPVYSWIPIYGAVDYEVELTTDPPENPNGLSPSQYQFRNQIIRGSFDCYDEEALSTPGTYYWRVRGLDESGGPIGVYSDAEEFSVSSTAGSYAGTLGDSITHGGGAISYSPANVEYSFQTYLAFPNINLGKSGDTSETMLNRFENDVLPYQPRFLIIMGGTNSLRGGVPAYQVIEELAAIRDKCILYGIRPIFLTLPPIIPEAIKKAFNEDTIPNWQEEFASVNSFIREQHYNIDIEPYFSDDSHNLPPQYAVDGLHLDIEGKQLMAQIINANWLRVTQ